VTAGLGRQRFAIVEDEPFMAELVSEMLTSSDADVDVEVFPLGADLFKSPGLLNFKAILLDLSLPDMAGFDIMDKLATLASKSSILVMSGHDHALVIAARIYGNGIGLRMRGALTKPFTRVQLRAALGLPA
jgi:DNA-binding response OmpR family regulator